MKYKQPQAAPLFSEAQHLSQILIRGGSPPASQAVSVTTVSFLREVMQHQPQKRSFPTLPGLTFKTANQHPPQKCVRPSCPRCMEAKAGGGQVERAVVCGLSFQWVSKPSRGCVLKLRPALAGNAFHPFPFLLLSVYFP